MTDETDQPRPTWDDYPYTPYPPFKDHEDWRESVNAHAMSERDAMRGREFVADATANHELKHKHHEHPWCDKCWDRVDAFERVVDGYEQPKTRAQIHREMADAQPQKLDERMRDKLRAMLNEGWTVKPGFETEYGVDFRSLQVWEKYLDDLSEIEYHEEQRRNAGLRRAARYLMIHGRPPADTYDPDLDNTTLADELLDRDRLGDLPAIEPLIDGILTRHAYALLSGRRSTYKSFLALDWALCLATGRPWLGRATEQLRVLYVVGEGAYGLEARVSAWEEHNATKVGSDTFAVLPRALNLYRGGRDFDELVRVVKEGSYGLVVFDTLRRMSSGAEANAEKDMGLVVDRIEKVKRATAEGSVLVVAHSDKGDNSTRGSSVIEDDAEILWTTKADDHRLELHNGKMKDGPDDERIHLAPRPVGESLVLETLLASHAPDTTDSQRVILETLRDSFSEGGASGTQLRDACDLPKSTYYLALNTLKASGHVVNTGSKSRPHLELASTLESNESNDSPTPAQASDLGHSNESNQSNDPGPRVQSSPAPLIGLDVGLGTGQTTDCGCGQAIPAHHRMCADCATRIRAEATA